MPLRIATKLSMIKSENIMKYQHGKEIFFTSTDVCGSYLLTSTSHIAHLGCMAGAGQEVIPKDVGAFSKGYQYHYRHQCTNT